MSKSEGTYTANRRETIAEAPNLRVRLLALGEGQCVPWHYHTNITDTFFCMQGPMQVSTRNPDTVHVLEPGGTCAVEPGTPHLVMGSNGGPCMFMVVQGVGVYDYVAVDD
jgi:quercetin dioxygenase-like cupin family protein